MASPASRRRAREAGIDLAQVQGSGPHGRITRKDLDAVLSGAVPAAPGAPPAKRPAMTLAMRTGTEEIKVIGVRRVIAIESRDNHAAIELEREKGFVPEPFDGDPTLVILAKTLR